VLVLAASCVVSLQASAQRLGTEFRVSTTSAGIHQHPSVAQDPSGRFVVVWESSTSGEILGQRYAADGARLGTEFRVTAAGSRPRVGSDLFGNFVVAWLGSGIFGRRFSAAGAPLGAEFRVDATTGFQQLGLAVAVLTHGGFVVAFSEEDGSGSGVVARRFDAAGVPLTGEFRVNTYTTSEQRAYSIGADAAGGFVVVWHSSASSVHGQLFDAGGAPVGTEFQKSSADTDFGRPSVAVAPGGEFLVAWQAQGPLTQAFDIFAQRYDRAGALLGGEFRVNTYLTSAQYEAQAAVTRDGEYVITWNSLQSATNDIYAQRFARTGAPLGGEFLVNTYTTGFTESPSVAATTGAFTIAWGHDSGGTNHIYTILGQRFRSGMALGDVDGSGTIDVGDVFHLINFLFAGGAAPVG